MQKYWLAFFLVSLFFFSANAQSTFVLSIEFTNIKVEGAGKLYVQVFNQTKEFQSDHIIAATERAQLQLTGLKQGQYWVRVYHDINDNGEMDTNYLGIPKEPYGFSNNVRPVFGPPAAEDMLFSLEEDTGISIALK